MRRNFAAAPYFIVAAALFAFPAPVLAACTPADATFDDATLTCSSTVTDLEFGDNNIVTFEGHSDISGTGDGLTGGDRNDIQAPGPSGLLSAADIGVLLGDENDFVGSFTRGFSAGSLADIGDENLFSLTLDGATTTLETGLVAGKANEIRLVNTGTSAVVVADGAIVEAGVGAEIELDGVFRAAVGDGIVAEQGSVTVRGELDADDTGVLLGDEADSVTNYGSITGGSGIAVDLRGGDDTLTLFAGASADGRLLGGAGEDTLRLDAVTGAPNSSVAAVEDFEILDAANGHWTLDGAFVFDTVTVAAPATLVAATGFTGAATVDGRLEAAGTISSLALSSGGTLSVAGAGIGTLSVDGTASLAGTVEIDLSVGGGNDLLEAGTVVISSGAKLQLRAGTGAYPDLTTPYTIITAETGVEGTFAVVEDDHAFFDALLDYDDPKVVAVTLVRNGIGFGDIGETRNQRAVASALDASGNSELAAELLGMSETGVLEALDDLSGELHASAVNLQLMSTELVHDAIRSRFGRLSDDVLQSSAWLSSAGQHSAIAGDGNAHTYDAAIGSLTAGVDMVSGPALGGVAIGVASGAADVTQRNSSIESTGGTVAAYGAYRFEQFKLDGGVSYSWAENDSRRVALGDTLTASYGGHSTGVFAEASYELQLADFMLEPFAALSHISAERDGFTEAGGIGALHSDGFDYSSTSSLLGIRVSYDTVLPSGIRISPRASAAWRHVAGDVPEAPMEFVSTGTGFTVAGLPLAADSLELGAGFELGLADNLVLDLAYSGQISQDDSSQQLRVTGRLSF